MKRLLLSGIVLVIYVLVVVTTQVFSTNTGKIKGKVINAKTKDPIAFAVIQISGTTMGAQAGPNGEYLIINVPPGKYELCAMLTGWTSSCVKELTVTANVTTAQDFSLAECPMDTQAQIVVAEHNLLKPSDPQQISPENIKNMPVETVQNLLKAQVGVVERSGEMKIRGGRPNGTYYCVDGVAVKDKLGGPGIVPPHTAATLLPTANRSMRCSSRTTAPTPSSQPMTTTCQPSPSIATTPPTR